MNGSQQEVTDINSFIDELIDKRQVEEKKISPQEREALQSTLIDQLGIFMLQSIYEELPEEQQKALNQLVDEGKPLSDIRHFAAVSIANYDQFIIDVMLDFEDAYLEGEFDQNDATSTFINHLIDQKQFANLTPELREEIFADIEQRLDEFIIARSIAQLTDEEVTHFKKMMEEKKTRSELQQYTMDHIADYPKFLDDTLNSFQEAYLA